MKLDLSSLASVRAFVAEFKASKLGLDSLILNAGVMHGVSSFLSRCNSTSVFTCHVHQSFRVLASFLFSLHPLRCFVLAVAACAKARSRAERSGQTTKGQPLREYLRPSVPSCCTAPQGDRGRLGGQPGRELPQQLLAHDAAAARPQAVTRRESVLRQLQPPQEGGRTQDPHRAVGRSTRPRF